MRAETDFQGLANQHDYRGIALALVLAEHDRGVYDLAALQVDPAGEIAASGEVEVRMELLPDDGCPVAGYYDHQVPAIVLHPSRTDARNRFTVLHELGHHVQRITLDWADVWCMLPKTDGERLNEHVADAFAAEILVPSASVDLTASNVTAAGLADAYPRVPTASRSALAHHALRDPAPADDVAIAVCDLDGNVIFARSVGRLWAPRSGAVQPGFRALIASAVRGTGRYSGPLKPGLLARSGNVQNDLVVETALDSSGMFAFVVVRLAYRFAPPSWMDRTIECASPACGESFSPDATTSRCPTCGAHRCPICGSCSCVNDAAVRCPSCHLTYSAAERVDPRAHECW